jgi:hypothetical protein
MEARNIKGLVELWTEALEGITGEEIKEGVKAIIQMRAGFSAFPPTAPQFRGVCLTARNDLRLMNHPRPQLVPLTQRMSGEEIAKRKQELKDALRGKYTPAQPLSQQGEGNMAE